MSPHNAALVSMATHGQLTPFDLCLTAIQSLDDETLLAWVHSEPALLHACDDAGFTLLHHAAHQGDARCIDALLGAGVPVDARSRHARHVTGATPLHVAIAAEREACVAALLRRSADVNARDDAGFTPLHLAVLVGGDAIVRRLLRAGADVNAWLGDETPRTLAERARDRHLVRILCKAGAS